MRQVIEFVFCSLFARGRPFFQFSLIPLVSSEVVTSPTASFHRCYLSVPLNTVAPFFPIFFGRPPGAEVQQFQRRSSWRFPGSPADKIPPSDLSQFIYPGFSFWLRISLFPENPLWSSRSIPFCKFFSTLGQMIPFILPESFP